MIAVFLLVSCGKKADETGSLIGSVTRDTIQGVPCCVYLPNAYAERVQSGVELFPVLYPQSLALSAPCPYPTVVRPAAHA